MVKLKVFIHNYLQPNISSSRYIILNLTQFTMGTFNIISMDKKFCRPVKLESPGMGFRHQNLTLSGWLQCAKSRTSTLEKHQHLCATCIRMFIEALTQTANISIIINIYYNKIYSIFICIYTYV